MKKRKRNRMLGYDYSQNNLYFVTICVKNMECCFGEIHSLVGTSRDLSMSDSDADSVPDFAPNSDFNSTSEFKAESKSKKIYLNEIGKIAKAQWDWLENQYPYIKLHTFIIMPNHIHGIIEIDRNLIISKQNKIKSLSALIGAYKMTTSKLIHLSGFLDFAWHRSFYDHIIRSENAYENIFNYIKMNPDKWGDDNYNATTNHEKLKQLQL